MTLFEKYHFLSGNNGDSWNSFHSMINLQKCFLLSHSFSLLRNDSIQFNSIQFNSISKDFMVLCFVYSICLKFCPRFGHRFTFLVYVRILIQKMKSRVSQTGVMNLPDVQSRLFTKSASFSDIFVKMWLEYQILSSNVTKLYCSESIIALVLCRLIEFWLAGNWFFERKLILRQYSHEFWFWSTLDKRIAMSQKCSIHN
jgi:hypothetical protein